MDAEICQTSLNGILERISRLEEDVMEMRRLLHVQTSHLEEPGNVPASLFTMSTFSRLGAPETGDWEIMCLGTFHLRCMGRDIPPCRSRHSQSILKYLLASPGFAASTEVLVECFWPHKDSLSGARNLQVAVHTLRCSLRGCGPSGSDETILFRHNRYLLNPALSIAQDVDSFRAAYERGLCAARAGRSIEAREAFEVASAYYIGDYLADPIEEWASSSRMALQDMRLNLLNRLGALYSEVRKWEPAIACYREILTVDCYREDVYRLLMRCYAASGRLADVKQTYLTCKGYLRRDLHLAPASETSMLYQQLIQQATPSDLH
jgi:DNA-binding SARP family transcriptional activator